MVINMDGSDSSTVLIVNLSFGFCNLDTLYMDTADMYKYVMAE